MLRYIDMDRDIYKMIQEKNRKLIEASVMFKNLDESGLEKALDLLEASYSEYKKNDVIHPAYKEMKAFGMVLSGVVQACMDDVEGNRIIMAEVAAGNTFGESLCFLEIKDSPVYVYASEPAEVLWISLKKLFENTKDDFAGLLQKRFTAMLASRTLNMNDRIQVLSRISIRDKLLTYFNQMSQAAGSLTFQIPINREDMATYMGINRSALSRELAKMKQEGLIDYYKNTFRLMYGAEGNRTSEEKN